MAAMLCDVVRRRRRRRWAHAPVIHAASHFDHKKRVAWVSISMHTCGSFFYNYGAPLGGPSGRRSSAIIYTMELLIEDYFEKKLERKIDMFQKETLFGLVDIIEKMHKHSIEDYKNVISCELEGDIISEYKFEKVYSEQFHSMFEHIAEEFIDRLTDLKLELIQKLDIKN